METLTDLGIFSAIWGEIELSESYLVCSMYEEAASLASSILKRLHDNGRDLATKEAGQVYDMLESTGMVLVQSLKGLGRTSDILNQLRLYYVSIKAIPAQVLLTGACLHIAEGSPLVVREFLEEFLNGWSLGDEQYWTVIQETNLESESRYVIIGLDKYLELVEIYAVKLLATVLNDINLAISWVEKASLLEENRQGLLRRLLSMHSLKTTNLSQSTFPQPSASNDEAYSLQELNSCEKFPDLLKNKQPNNRKYSSKDTFLKLSERIKPCFWCFRAINLKFGRSQIVISKGKIMLGCLILLIYYVFKKKQANFKRIIRRQVIAAKRALVDLWQLAFSYQVNPLAAVQPFSAGIQGGQ